MSDNIVEITENNSYSITIDTSLIQNDNNIVIETSSPSSIDVINNTTVLVSDLPQGYPLSSTTENLPVSRVSGLIGVSGVNYSSGVISLSGVPIELLPVQNLLAGSGIEVSENSGIFTVAVTGQFGLTSEQVDDRVNNLLFAGNYINLNYDDQNDKLTIHATGLQPSGDYSLVGHSHISSDVTDFSSSVSGLFPSVSGTGYAVTSFDNNIYTVSVTGLQPSGNYADSIHASSHLPSGIDQLFDQSLNMTDSPTFGGITIDNGTVNGGIQVFEEQDTTVFEFFADSASVATFSTGSANFVGLLSSNQQTVVLDNDGRLSDARTPSAHAASHAAGGSDALTLKLEQITDFGGNTILGGDGNPAELFLYNLAVNAWQDAFIAAGGTLRIGSTSGLPVITTTEGYLTTGAFGTSAGEFAEGDHSHAASDITDFSSSVSGLLPSVSGIGYTVTSFDNNIYTVSVTGLQPSGNYSVAGHTHFSSDITDFNSSVSGLLPVKNIIAGSGIGISSASGDFTVSVTGSFGLTSEEVDDRVSNLLVAGSYINLNYDDNLNTLTILSTGLQPSGNYSLVGHNHTIADVSGLQSALDSKQPSGVYASGVHFHVSSDVTDFSSSVSGLLPVKDIVSGSGISIGSVSGVYTITAAGVAASSASSLVTNCSNRTGSVIPKMTVVYINGGHGNLPTITPAQANNEANSSKSYGITQTQINDNSNGNVVAFGSLIDVDTNQFGASEGSILYLSPTTAGGITATKPSAPNHMVSVGKIVRNHNNQGIIEVVIQNGFELQELHNVAISGVNNGEFLQYNSSSGLWVASNSGNFSVLNVNGTGVSLSGHSHTSSNITDFNISVSGLLPVTNILGGSNVSVSQSGTNFTVAVTGSLGLTTEEVDDRVSSLLIAGSGISLNYNDNAHTLTISTIKNTILSDFVGSTNYIGIAPSGTSTSSPAWRIKRTIYSSDGSVSSTGTALNVSWNDRLTAIYT